MEKRRYSLYQKINNHWVRVSSLTFTKSNAVRVFQNHLLGAIMHGAPRTELRPIKSEDEPVSVFITGISIPENPRKLSSY